jgi:hypothetical protein
VAAVVAPTEPPPPAGTYTIPMRTITVAHEFSYSQMQACPSLQQSAAQTIN